MTKRLLMITIFDINRNHYVYFVDERIHTLLKMKRGDFIIIFVALFAAGLIYGIKWWDNHNEQEVWSQHLKGI